MRLRRERRPHLKAASRTALASPPSALRPTATIVDHVHQCAQRARRETKVRRRQPGIRKLRVPHSDQLTRAVLDFDDEVSLTAMPPAPHHPDYLSSQGMVLRCDTNRLEVAGIYPLFLLTG